MYLNGVPLARELFTKWLDEDPYGTGDSTNIVVDVHRPDSKGFGDAEAAADAWREAVAALDEPDDDDALVAEVLRVADANTVDGAVDTSHLTSYGELGSHVMRELGPGAVAVDYVERCALTWRAKRDEPRGPWWRTSTDFTELPAKVSPSSEEEVFDEDEDDGALMGATNALAARLKAAASQPHAPQLMEWMARARNRAEIKPPTVPSIQLPNPRLCLVEENYQLDPPRPPTPDPAEAAAAPPPPRPPPPLAAPPAAAVGADGRVAFKVPPPARRPSQQRPVAMEVDEFGAGGF